MWTSSAQQIDWDSLDTGDLILFHGERYWFSYLVEWFTWSDFSHIGIVLRDPIYLDQKLKGLYMLESGTENFPDAIEHRIHYGVQVVNLKKALGNYTGDMYLRKLAVSKTFRDNMDQVLGRVWDRIKDKPYDDHVWDLIRAEFRLDWGDNNRCNNFFCSALAAFLFEQFGFFRKPIAWDLIEPKDFDDNGRLMDLLIENVKLDPKCQVEAKCQVE